VKIEDSTAAPAFAALEASRIIVDPAAVVLGGTNPEDPRIIAAPAVLAVPVVPVVPVALVALVVLAVLVTNRQGQLRITARASWKPRAVFRIGRFERLEATAGAGS